MLNNKEQFRNFEKNLLLFFAAEAPAPASAPEPKAAEAPQPPPIEGLDIEYGRLRKVGSLKEIPEGEEPMSEKQFGSKKRAALATLKKIHLDAKASELSKEEQALHDGLQEHINNEFKLLEHNYFEELTLVGRGNEKANKARDTLNKAADKFTFDLEMHILNESIYKGTEKGALMVKSRLIDEYTKVPGFGRHLAESNPNMFGTLLNAKDRQAFNKELEYLLDNEKLLEGGIRHMIDKVPKLDKDRNTSQARAHFNDLIDASWENKDPKKSLTFHLGIKQRDILLDTLTRRFDIKFAEGTWETPEHYIDLMDNNRVYKPDQIDAVLLRLTRQNNFKNRENLEEYNEEINEAEEEQDLMHEELLEGRWYVGDEEVTGLSTLRDNPKLRKLIEATDRYENIADKEVRELNEQLDEFNGIKAKKGAEDALNKVRGALTPERIRSGALGKISALVSLLELVRTLANNGSIDGLGEVAEGISKGENPAEASKAAKENYGKMLSKASVSDLFNAYLQPKSEAANKLFSKEAAKDIKDVDVKQLDKYRHIAVPQAIEGHLKDSLGITTLLNIKPVGDTGNKYQFDFKKGGVTKLCTLHISGKTMEITVAGDTANSIVTDNNLSALKTALFETKPAAKKKAEVKTDTIPTNTTYIDNEGVLKKAASSTTIHKVLDTKKYEAATIKLGNSPRPKDQQFEKGVTEINVVRRKVAGVLTYVIADDQPHHGKRLFVYEGDKILSVKEEEKK